MKDKKPLIICTLVLAFSSSPPLSSGQKVSQRKQIIIDTENKAAIIRAVLKQELSGEKVLDVGYPVHLSTENIAGALSTGLIPSNLIIITPARIQGIESQKRRLGYLQFGAFIARNHTVQTSLTHRDEFTGLWTGLVYECKRNTDKKWACKSIKRFSVGS